MHFWSNFKSIFSIAFFGGVFSTFLTSGLVWIAAQITKPVNIDGVSQGLAIIECLIFGALISSTDPVTVLSLLPDNVDQRLYMLIFGESALNDAVSVILFAFFTSLSDPTRKIGPGDIALSVAASAGVFIGMFSSQFPFLFFRIFLTNAINRIFSYRRLDSYGLCEDHKALQGP